MAHKHRYVTWGCLEVAERWSESGELISLHGGSQVGPVDLHWSQAVALNTWMHIRMKWLVNPDRKGNLFAQISVSQAVTVKGLGCRYTEVCKCRKNFRLFTNFRNINLIVRCV